MGKKEILIARMKLAPHSFTYEEAVTLLGLLSFYECNKGKTSGSRVMFKGEESSVKISLHKPHPQKELPLYAVKQLIMFLEREGLI